jgi:hypothetical protein
VFVIFPASGLEIQILQRNFAGVARSHIEKSLADNRVIPDFELMAVLEDEQGGLQGIGSGRRVVAAFCRVSGRNIPRWWHVRSLPGAPPVKYRRAALIVGVRLAGIGVCIILGLANVDRVGKRNSISDRRNIGDKVVMMVANSAIVDTR